MVEKREKRFHKIIFLLYASLFLFTPLVMTSVTSELFEFNKMIFIYFTATLIGFFWLLKMIIFKKIIIKKTPFDGVIVLFLISQFLSTVFSIDRHTSIFGYYSRFNGGLLSIVTYIFLFYGFVSNLELRDVISLLKISLLASFLVILWGLPGKMGYDMSCRLFTHQFNNSCWTDQFRPAERMFSTLGQPNWLGAYLAINFFIGLYFAMQSLNYWRVVYRLYLPINFLSIIFTRSRSAFVSIIFGLLIFILFFLYQRLRKMFIAVFTILFFLLVMFLVIKKNEIINYFNLDISPLPVTESFDIRKIVWKGAIDLGLKYPLFGTGVETFAYSYYFVRPWQHNLTSEWDYLYNKAHNEYLNYFATTGFFGLAAYLIMIGSILFFVFRNIKTIKSNNLFLVISFLLSYLTILITNFFGFSTTTINLSFYLIPAFLILTTSTSKSSTFKPPDQLSLSQKIFAGLLLFFIFYCLFFIFKYWYADILYAEADQYAKEGNYQLAVNLLSQALKFKYEHVYEDKLSYFLANLSFLISYQKQSDLAKKLMTASQIYNQKALLASPKNILYWKTKAKNYYFFYQITLDKKYLLEGIKTLNYILTLSPTDPKIPYSLASFYLLLADEAKDKKEKEEWKNLSLKMINEAIKLKPNFRDGYLLKGELLKKYGQKDKAREVFQFILDKINPDDQEAKKELEEL